MSNPLVTHDGVTGASEVVALYRLAWREDRGGVAATALAGVCLLVWSVFGSAVA